MLLSTAALLAKGFPCNLGTAPLPPYVLFLFNKENKKHFIGRIYGLLMLDIKYVSAPDGGLPYFNPPIANPDQITDANVQWNFRVEPDES